MAPDAMPPAGRRGIFAKLWIGIFLGSSAMFLLLMTASAVVYANTGSAFLSNTVVLTQWLPAVVALRWIKRTASRRAPRSVLIGCEAVALAIVPLAVATVSHSAGLILVLLVQGVADNLSKIARPTALRSYFDGAQLDRAASYYNTAQLLGGGVGALAGAFLISQLDFGTAAAVSGLLRLGALAACARLPASAPLPAAAPAMPSHSSMPRNLGVAIGYFVAAVALYQGYHNIARSIFPIQQLGLTEAGIPMLQGVTNFAFIIGALAAAQIGIAWRQYRVLGPLLHGCCLASLLSLPLITDAAAGIVAYAAFAFLYEVAFCLGHRFIIVNAPAAELPRILANVNALAVGCMSVLSLLGSYLADHVSFAGVSMLVAVLAVLAMLPVHGRAIAIRLVPALARRLR